jgi:hypothetical protein
MLKIVIWSIMQRCCNLSVKSVSAIQYSVLLKNSNKCKGELYKTKQKTPWLLSASELHRPSDRRLSAKFVPTFAWSAQRILKAVNLGFLDRSRYFSIQVAPQLSSRGWVDPVPDPLLLWPLDHRVSRCTKQNNKHFERTWVKNLPLSELQHSFPFRSFQHDWKLICGLQFPYNRLFWSIITYEIVI